MLRLLLASLAVTCAFTPGKPPLRPARKEPLVEKAFVSLSAAVDTELKPWGASELDVASEPTKHGTDSAVPFPAALGLRCLAEAVGTAFLVIGFSLVASFRPGIVRSSIGIGLVIAMAVRAVASFSGAHFNPAVTLAAAAGGSLRPADVPAYCVAQFAGATLASAAWSLLAGASTPGVAGAFSAEVLLTAALVFGAFGVGDWVSRGFVSSHEAPLLVGSWIGGLNLCFSARLGAGLNPAISFGARSAAAALGGASGALGGAWAFLAGPCVGGVLGGGLLAVWLGHGGGWYAAVARQANALFLGLARLSLPRMVLEAEPLPLRTTPAPSLGQLQRLGGGGRRKALEP